MWHFRKFYGTDSPTSSLIINPRTFLEDVTLPVKVQEVSLLDPVIGHYFETSDSKVGLLSQVEDPTSLLWLGSYKTHSRYEKTGWRLPLLCVKTKRGRSRVLKTRDT